MIHLPIPNTLPYQKDTTGRIQILEDNYYGIVQNLCIYIKKGFRYDGKSAPRFLWGLTGGSHTGKGKVPDFIHDAFYGCMGKGNEDLYNRTIGIFNDIFEQNDLPDIKEFEFCEYSRYETDRLWYNLNRHFGMGWVRSNIQYHTVRAVGGEVWDKDKDIAEANRNLITIFKLV